ncbi:MAG: GerMN domain-containing protein [Desulfitobacterium sp.]
MRKCFLYLGVLLIVSALLGGCGTLQTLVKEDSEKSLLADWIGGNSEEATIPATSNLGDGKMISLYFPDATGKVLIKEERSIPKTLSLARETVNQWLMGPAVQGSTQGAVDPATSLVDIAIKDGVAIVDLSREFTQVYGNVDQEVAVYGLVNTLTQFPTVREVTFRIEGKALTRLGSLDVTRLSYREGLVLGGGAVKEDSSNIVSPISPQNTNPADSPSSINIFSAPATTS